MSSPAGIGGLSLEQAPPIGVPLSFFLSAPPFVAAAGVWLLIHGQTAFTHRLAPATVILTHTATLGFLTMVMCGALYQMLPVVAASPVPRVRLAHGAHASLSAGTLCLLIGIHLGHKQLLIAAYTLLGLFLVVFLLPIGRALFPKEPPGEPALLAGPPHPASSTLWGMRWAVSALLLLAVAGIWLAHGYGGYAFPPGRLMMMQWHLGLALLVWVGGLITAVSWQVVPMFYLTNEIPPRHRWRLLVLLASGLALPTAWLLTTALGATLPGWSELGLRLAFVPVGLGVWLYNPWLLYRAIRHRRRTLSDPSLDFWKLGLACGPLAALLALLAIDLEDPRLALAFGWTCIWGWAGATVHGMLYRIVPFLVWFHRCSHLIGIVKVPSAKKLLPDKHARPCLWLHGATLLLGLLAIGSRSHLLAQCTGVLLTMTGVYLARNLLKVAVYRPPPRP